MGWVCRKERMVSEEKIGMVEGARQKGTGILRVVENKRGGENAKDSKLR